MSDYGWRQGNQEKGRGGFHGWRGGRGGRGGRCGMGAGRGFMGMMKKFMDKMGGEGKCKEMKNEFANTMKEGTEEQKKEQFEKMGEIMKEFGKHMEENAGTMGQEMAQWG